jgi:fructose/tagatose bisphosphate aldolase
MDDNQKNHIDSESTESDTTSPPPVLPMPIASPAQYRAMLDAAQEGGYAYPAVNIATVTSIHGALRGFAEAKSDGILQILPSSGAFASGSAVLNAAEGAMMLAVYEELRKEGRYLLATAFGNVHGGIREGTLDLRPEILRNGQALLRDRYGDRFDLVFHGGSGTPAQLVRQCVSHGVVKMNMDTDTQYAFSRPIAEHMLKNFDTVLKVDGNIGEKAGYDPRVWLVKGEQGICDRVNQACQELMSAGRTLFSQDPQSAPALSL